MAKITISTEGGRQKFVNLPINWMDFVILINFTKLWEAVLKCYGLTCIDLLRGGSETTT